MRLKSVFLSLVALVSAFTLLILLSHEYHATGNSNTNLRKSAMVRSVQQRSGLYFPSMEEIQQEPMEFLQRFSKPIDKLVEPPPASSEWSILAKDSLLPSAQTAVEAMPAIKDQLPGSVKMAVNSIEEDDGAAEEEIERVASIEIEPGDHDEHEKLGTLMCDGKDTKSEVIYWKVVPGDSTFESPITPHHGIHHDKYITFEYDNGGWNNMRMAIECLIVCGHAMGRTVVMPPFQNLYLIANIHKDKHDVAAHSQMGFEDFFAADVLRSHKGFHVISMKEFLEKEALTGGLHGEFPPGNTSDAWGQPLWRYLERVADVKPAWSGAFIAFPDRPGNFNFSKAHHPRVMERMKRFGGGSRFPVYYEQHLQDAHHIHFPGSNSHRLLEHHYAFAFFASPAMQSFYKRFIRDYMRYRDEIQCLGHELVAAVRADARTLGIPSGDYYALHIRRGDFQFKEVKLGAESIVKALQLDGKPIIPPGSVVYISTDDPDGVCKDCRVNGRLCLEYSSPKPTGCPEDPSWNAFIDFGWKIRFLKDYKNLTFLKNSNSNVHGMVESIVCSRAKAFAGTWFSTFTGYIHRLRGYHGLGEATFYHSPGHITQPQSPQSVGHGFSREWRAGWTDDAGDLI